jgi:hypothetical protein
MTSQTRLASLILGVAWTQVTVGQAVSPARPSVPSVTVADLIGMTLLGSDPHNGALEEDAHALSPDGTHVAAVLQRGDLKTNTVEYTLVVFNTAGAQRALRPDSVATFTSASNDPAISGVHWLADNHTLAFLGGPAGEPRQVYTVDIATRRLSARTHSRLGITGFEIGLAGEPVIYQEQGAIDTSRYAAQRARGFVVPPKAWLSDMIAGTWLESGPAWFAIHYPKGYRIARGGAVTTFTLPDSTTGHKDCELQTWYGPAISPRGDAVVMTCKPSAVPAMWQRYRNARYRLWIDKFADYGRELVLLDLATGRTRLVFAAPLPDEANFLWAPDGRSLLVANTLLPLTGPDSAVRATQIMTAEIDVGTGAISVVAARDSLVAQRWDAATGVVDFAVAPALWEVTGATSHVHYRKSARGWTNVSGTAVALRPRLIVDQGPSMPPRLAVVDPRTHAARAVFDPNPDLLTAHRFGRVEVFHWTTKTGHRFAGGLYYPPDYVPGRRYPVVIQTHGYDSTRFAPDGVFTTDEAAQPLANAGIMVLQASQHVDSDKVEAESIESPAEAPFVQDVYEGAIDGLDRGGLIDRTRIGLQGFSRTCFYTLYFLTHSSYPVAAADIADGVDYSYFQSLAFMTDADKINGGRPWGATQAAWLDRASGFRLDRVMAPLRVTALGPHSLLEEWEPYAGLRLQGKPTELVYIPDGSHILVKPWERLTSQQGVVDWWRFWLQDVEDPDPAKAEQYARWHRLRAERDSTARSTSTR